VQEIAEQVNQFYNEERLVSEHYRQLILSRSDVKYQQPKRIKYSNPLSFLLNDLGMVSMVGYDKSTIRPVGGEVIEGIDGVAPKEIIIVYYYPGIEQILLSIAQQRSEGAFVAENDWFEVIYQKIEQKGSNNAKSIILTTPYDQISENDLHLEIDSANLTIVFQNGEQTVAPLGFGTIMSDINCLYNLITPTLIQLSRQLTGQYRHLPHP
jgi:hypothetical protein